MQMEQLTSSLTHKIKEIENRQEILEKNIAIAQKLADQILQQKRTETKQLIAVGFLGLCGLAAAVVIKSVFETVNHNLKR